MIEIADMAISTAINSSVNIAMKIGLLAMIALTAEYKPSKSPYCGYTGLCCNWGFNGVL